MIAAYMIACHDAAMECYAAAMTTNVTSSLGTYEQAGKLSRTGERDGARDGGEAAESDTRLGAILNLDNLHVVVCVVFVINRSPFGSESSPAANGALPIALPIKLSKFCWRASKNASKLSGQRLARPTFFPACF
jgi:hypothetical protein